MTRRFALIAYGFGILAALLVIHGVTVLSQTFLCVNRNLHSQLPNPDKGEIWGACLDLHLSFPFSFFR